MKMMNVWKRTGTDKILRQAYKKGIVLSGLSAGAICWFKWGNSDSRRFNNPKAGLVKVSGLGLIKALGCPHPDGKGRWNSLKAMMKKTPGVGITLDNCSALEIMDDKCRIVSSKLAARAHKVYWKGGKYYEKIIKK